MLDSTTNIETLTVFEGELPQRALGHVLEWAGEHQQGLLENWELCRNRQHLKCERNINYRSKSRNLPCGSCAMPSVRDAKDEPVLASAIHADVDILITGDKDFSAVQIDRPVILTPAAFLEMPRQM